MSEAARLIITRAVIAIIAAGIGGLIGVIWKKPGHRTLCALVSFAAGALLAVTITQIIPEAAEIEGVGWLRAILATTAGVIIFYLIGKYVYYMCPACAASATEVKGGYLQLGVLLMVALGIHSTVDGLAIAASSKTSQEIVALLVLLAVSYHKIPEGLALVSIAQLAGFQRLKSLGVTLLIELTTGLGAFIGLLVLGAFSQFWLGVTLGIIGGSFLYVVGFAILREMIEHESKSILIYFTLGFISIVVIGILLPVFGIANAH
ncbi:MAG: ZIP family metal transporter [Armatimonadota bacterium]